MLQSTWYIIFFTAIIPLIIGYIWYHPKVFGTRLANLSGTNISQIGVFHNPKRILSIYGFGVLISYMIMLLSIHQIAPHLLFFMEPQMSDPNYEGQLFLKQFLEQFGDRHRSFGHGALHGIEMCLFWSVGALGITAFIEGQSFKKLWIHVGFFVLCGWLIGGVMGAFFSFG